MLTIQEAITYCLVAMTTILSVPLATQVDTVTPQPQAIIPLTVASVMIGDLSMMTLLVHCTLTKMPVEVRLLRLNLPSYLLGCH
ncbi:MAG: hypothetical protein PUP90_10730 [Nostoc sp. S4]|nr:hypothetical protein [Nostoc sp. S4]